MTVLNFPENMHVCLLIKNLNPELRQLILQNQPFATKDELYRKGLLLDSILQSEHNFKLHSCCEITSFTTADISLLDENASSNINLNGPLSEKDPSQVSNNCSVTNPNGAETYCSDNIASASQLVAKVESNRTSDVVKNEQPVVMKQIDVEFTETAKNSHCAKSDNRSPCDCVTKIDSLKGTLAPQAKRNNTESYQKYDDAPDLSECYYFSNKTMETHKIFSVMLCFVIELIIMTIMILGFAYGYCNDKHDLPNNKYGCVLKLWNQVFRDETNIRHMPPYPVPKVSLRMPLKQKEVENDPDPPDKIFVYILVRMVMKLWTCF